MSHPKPVPPARAKLLFALMIRTLELRFAKIPHIPITG